eukprot:GHVS01080531.1.p1 GENE.GHVS01080531.1~~GHVS01080531.1.p1  ORF type:complete len:288 (-),score=38.53 GHVS01080531.1:172-1035(-)
MKLTNPFRRHIVFILLIAVSALLLATLTVAPGDGPPASTEPASQPASVSTVPVKPPTGIGAQQNPTTAGLAAAAKARVDGNDAQSVSQDQTSVPVAADGGSSHTTEADSQEATGPAAAAAAGGSTSDGDDGTNENLAVSTEPGAADTGSNYPPAVDDKPKTGFVKGLASSMFGGITGFMSPVANMITGGGSPKKADTPATDAPAVEPDFDFSDEADVQKQSKFGYMGGMITEFTQRVTSVVETMRGKHEDAEADDADEAAEPDESNEPDENLKTVVSIHRERCSHVR